MRYRVSHRTVYSYDQDVRDSLGIAHLAPRRLSWQQVHSHRLQVTPGPSDASQDSDGYGNLMDYFHVTAAHHRLTVDAVSEVTVLDPVYDPDALDAPWEAARPLDHPGSWRAWAATDFALESPQASQLPELTGYTAASLAPGRPIGEAVTDLMRRINADFAYDPTATTVTSTVAQVWAERAGVCQDFAHLALACLRSHGLAARYVSGYLATDPAPGRQRLVGADASHAWVAVWLPGADDWLAVDPTNDQWADARYVTLAWGRDYGDVVPVKGVIFTEATRSTLRVSVDVTPIVAS